MHNEWVSHTVFDALADQLDRAGFDADLGDTCRQFADEERSHGVLCAAVVHALGGDARATVAPRPDYPLHADAPPRAAVLRNVISVCCLSETVAVALIGAERHEMPEGPLRDLLTRIWADEIGHARFGWKLLEAIAHELTAAERAAVAVYVPTALEHLEAYEHAFLPLRSVPTGGAALGLCSGRDARGLLAETVDAIIRPGLGRWFA